MFFSWSRTLTSGWNTSSLSAHVFENSSISFWISSLVIDTLERDLFLASSVSVLLALDWEEHFWAPEWYISFSGIGFSNTKSGTPKCRHGLSPSRRPNFNFSSLVNGVIALCSSPIASMLMAISIILFWKEYSDVRVAITGVLEIVDNRRRCLKGGSLDQIWHSPKESGRRVSTHKWLNKRYW